MKREKSKQQFNWSRVPSQEGIHSVYIATPGSYTTYGKDITKEEMANSLATWIKIEELNAKKALFKKLFIITLASIPFISIIYNMVKTILEKSI